MVDLFFLFVLLYGWVPWAGWAQGGAVGGWWGEGMGGVEVGGGGGGGGIVTVFVVATFCQSVAKQRVYCLHVGANSGGHQCLCIYPACYE